MVFALGTSKISISDVRGICDSFPEACIPDLICAVNRKKIEPEWKKLTKQAKNFVEELIASCESKSISRVCDALYEKEGLWR